MEDISSLVLSAFISTGHLKGCFKLTIKNDVSESLRKLEQSYNLIIVFLKCCFIMIYSLFVLLHLSILNKQYNPAAKHLKPIATPLLSYILSNKFRKVLSKIFKQDI